MEIYDRLPDSLKKQKTILLLRLTAAASLTPEQQEDAAIRDFRSACPHDPALDLILIDRYYYS